MFFVLFIQFSIAFRNKDDKFNILNHNQIIYAFFNFVITNYFILPEHISKS